LSTFRYRVQTLRQTPTGPTSRQTPPLPLPVLLGAGVAVWAGVGLPAEVLPDVDVPLPPELLPPELLPPELLPPELLPLVPLPLPLPPESLLVPLLVLPPLPLLSLPLLWLVPPWLLPPLPLPPLPLPPLLLPPLLLVPSPGLVPAWLVLPVLLLPLLPVPALLTLVHGPKVPPVPGPIRPGALSSGNPPEIGDTALNGTVPKPDWPGLPRPASAESRDAPGKGMALASAIGGAPAGVSSAVRGRRTWIETVESRRKAIAPPDSTMIGTVLPAGCKRTTAPVCRAPILIRSLKSARASCRAGSEGQ